MKSKILITILTLVSWATTAQTPYRNVEKYWWYRYRLVNDFMKIGPECGESIPATVRWREYEYDRNSPWDGLQWGDATQHLGNYINMLAGEQTMLRSCGLASTVQTWSCIMRSMPLSDLTKMQKNTATILMEIISVKQQVTGSILKAKTVFS